MLETTKKMPMGDVDTVDLGSVSDEDLLFSQVICGDSELLFLDAYLGEILRKYRPLHGLYWVLERMGIYSFELYLVHAFLYAYLMEHITPMLPNIPWNLLWAMTIPVILVGCFLLNRSAALLSLVFAKIAGIIAPII
jgi:hypothetical protein